MMDKQLKRLIWSGILACFPMLMYLFAVQGAGKSGQSYLLVKGAAIALYYMFYYTGKWITGLQIGVLLLVAFLSWKLAEKKKETGFWKDAGFRILTTAIAVAGSFCSVVIQTGSVETNKMCFVGLWCIVMLWMVEFAADCSMWLYAGVMGAKNGDSGRLEKIAVILGGVIVLALGLCIIGGGLYVYTQGDDFEYGAYAHQAIEAGYGLQGALGGAAKMVAKSYKIWQGTFSSIFLMALQPGIWGEKYYHLTPLLLIGLLLSALFFFMDSLFRKVCGAKKREVFLLFLLAAFLMTQLVPAQVSAFYWWNGAIHYTGAIAFLLYMVSFVIRAAVGTSKKKFYITAACVAAVMVGGGNLVTALIGSVLVIYALIAVGISKRRELLKYILTPGMALASAFIINIAAPGNWIRQGNSGEIIEYGVIGSIIKSFEVCTEYALGEWIDIFWILMVLSAMPLLAKIASRFRFSYPLPGIVSLAAFCMLSAMYTPQLYAIGEWDTGRIQNIIYDMFIIETLVLEFYWLGWIQKQNALSWDIGMTWKWYAACSAAGMAAFVLTAAADPESMTSSAVLAAVSNGEAQEYADAIQENIRKIKRSPDDELIQIQEPPQKPEIFKSNEIETWRYGTAAYYGKNKIRYYGEE
ncbi:MAG: hypothetical protein UIQ90_00015 [Eisenbergiella sp.]